MTNFEFAKKLVGDMAICAAEAANGPDVYFVCPDLGRTADAPLCAVQLPRDIGRFVLVDDPDGYEVMFKYRGRWRSLRGDCWLQTKGIEKDPCEAHYVSVVTFGRKILRRHKVREIT